MSHNENTLPQIPKGIWVLGFVSMLMDISSEMIHSLLPLFMVTTLGTSVLVVGIIEGLAESTALIIKVFSGILSDYIGKRKGLAVFGYALGALTKPLFAIASSSGLILAARLLDRIGKGVRGAPRDALVADIAPPHLRGAAFGLRQSLDTVGAFLGPLLAVGLMLLWSNDFRAVFWVAVIPGMLAVMLFFFGIKEPERHPSEKRINPIRKQNLLRLSPAYWRVVAIGAFFMLARFSEAFLVLRGLQAGIPICTDPFGNGRHEHYLCRVCLSLWQALRSSITQWITCTGANHFNYRRYSSGAEQSLEHSLTRRCLMGHTHGYDTRTAGSDGSQHCTLRFAWHRLWLF